MLPAWWVMIWGWNDFRLGVEMVVASGAFIMLLLAFVEHDLWWVGALAQVVAQFFCRHGLLFLKFLFGIFQFLHECFGFLRIGKQCFVFTKQRNQIFSNTDNACDGGYIHV